MEQFPLYLVVKLLLFVFFFTCCIACLSQAIYVYQKAAILSMLPEEEVTQLGENVAELFRCVFFFFLESAFYLYTILV